MRRSVLAWLLLAMASVAQAADVTVTWQANTEADLAGYEIHYGSHSGVYTFPGSPKIVGKQTNQVITGLPEGQTIYFAMKAFDTTGNRSGFSIEVPKLIKSPPKPTVKVTGVDTDENGATARLEGDAKALRYFHDTQQQPEVAQDFKAGDKTYRLNLKWIKGKHSFVCFQPEDPVTGYTPDNYQCQKVVPGEPGDTDPPAPPKGIEIIETETGAKIICEIPCEMGVTKLQK